VADRLLVVAGAVDAVGRLRVEGGLQDPRVDLSFEVARLDFARLLATAGLDLAASDLGSASLAGHVSGRLFAPSQLVVTQRLDFTPPARVPPALTRLSGPFVHQAQDRDGRTTAILVAPESPDFVPLAEVPPLFLRALLLAEDANFYGHQGIDLSELPAALATNLARGAFVRGASTLSQQLAKNLFLSRSKTIGRKLEEASLALLLDSALGKRRVLEIYLNVIEWGPGLYGLRPAARRYFGEEPGQLSPKQIAFLVSLIPGPLKYQRSFETGVPTPFFEGLMTTLLRKLVDVGAIDEAEYETALTAPLGLRVAALPAGGNAADEKGEDPAAGAQLP
jgi:penicillin-binding protein 1A